VADSRALGSFRKVQPPPLQEKLQVALSRHSMVQLPPLQVKVQSALPRHWKAQEPPLQSLLQVPALAQLLHDPAGHVAMHAVPEGHIDAGPPPVPLPPPVFEPPLPLVGVPQPATKAKTATTATASRTGFRVFMGATRKRLQEAAIRITTAWASYDFLRSSEPFARLVNILNELLSLPKGP
jgi:hypothetical protein